MKRRYKDVLGELMQDGHLDRHEKESASKMTSLGVPLILQDDGTFLIDVSPVRVFSGISTFVRVLTGEVMEQCLSNHCDLMVQHKVDANITPELEDMGVFFVGVYARDDLAEQLPNFREQFAQQLRFIFSALQTAKWGGLLFPAYFPDRSPAKNDKQNVALMFPFHLWNGGGNVGYFFLVEYNKLRRFLRITVEDASASRLNLRHIPHRVVAHLDLRDTFIDMIVLADTVFHGMLMEFRNHCNVYVEYEAQQTDLFKLLKSTGLDKATNLAFHWPLENLERFLPDQRQNTIHFLAKVLLLLTNGDIIKVLANNSSVEVISDDDRSYLDISHRGMSVNISLDEARDRLTMDYFLRRMPVLANISKQHASTMENVRILMLHHNTAEVLGAAKALEEMNCSALCTFFVEYAGGMPRDYLEAILAQPERKFRFYSLQGMSLKQSVEEYYLLSRDYSSIRGMEKLEEKLAAERLGFFQAMQLVAGFLFMQQALACKQNGERLLLIEDGGYLAPLLNQLCLENRTLGYVLQHFDVNIRSERIIATEEELAMSFFEWLDPIYIGSTEVTRSGHNRISKVQQRFGSLAFSACSIAISKLKRGWEAEETAIAINGSIERIINTLGMIVSKRRILVLGSRGAIGSNMMKYFSGIATEKNVVGVDIVVDPATYAGTNPNEGSRWIERKSVEELPKEILYKIDLFAGVTATSLIKPELICDLLLNSSQDKFIFASGSSETVEFDDLSNWLNSLMAEEDPTICKIPVRFELKPIQDPGTKTILGKHVKINFDQSAIGKSFTRELYLLADLMPVNFLYYGTPCEIIDHVTAQLIQVSAGLVRSFRSKDTPLPLALLSVDHEITPDAKLLTRSFSG
jgi:hypothetical protein